MSFFQNLNFTASNEDGRSELAGLAGPCERLLCITGSGTRPLDMLLSHAQQVIALDMNPAQTALLRLKIAAMRVLDQPAMLAFLGLVPGDPLALWPRVRAELSDDEQAYWDARQTLLAQGIWYAGLWERVLRRLAKGLRLLRGRQVDALFEAADVAAQAEIWDRHFDDGLWRILIRLLSQRWLWTRIVGEPGGAFLPAPAVVEARLRASFNRAAATFLFRESDFAALMLRGANALPLAVPLHLQAQHYDQVRERLERLEPRTASLADLDASWAIDAFSLSDFGSYTGPQAYAKVWAGVVRAARPGARFVERAFMNPMPLPDARIWVDQDLSDRLTATDRAIIYNLRAGWIE